MKTEESLSNESLGEQRRRFNGSSASSTPENEQLPLRGKFIEFQQYGSIAAASNAGSLKIRIDDEEEHERGVIEETSESQASAREDPYQQQYQSDDHLQLLIEYREKIDRLSSRVITLEERLYYYEDYNRRLLRENEQIRASQEQHCHRLQEMERALQAKQHNSQLQKELILNLNKKIEYLEAQQGYLQGFAERLNQKDGKLRELSKTLERVLQINHELQTELRQANRKIVQLEKDTQRLSCMQIEQNLFRIKEQGGKQNLDGNGGYRKSLRRADRPVTFKTEPNERTSQPFERVHFSRNF